MKRAEIYRKLEEVIRDVLGLDELSLSDETTANDVPGWDSLAHITIISAIEEEFDIRFSMQTVITMKNVGEMVDLIEGELE